MRSDVLDTFYEAVKSFVLVGPVVIHIVGTGQRRGLVQNDFALEMSREKNFFLQLFCIRLG